MDRWYLIRICVFAMVLIARGTLALASSCALIFADTETRPIFIRRSELGVDSFDANSFYNGALLKELFGPTRNEFKKWLEWLESDGTSQEPPLPNLVIYRYPRGFGVGKRMEFPQDTGLLMNPDVREATNRVFEVMKFVVPDASQIKGSSDSARQARDHLVRTLEMQLFGVYGPLGKDWYQEILARAIGSDNTLRASVRRGIKYRAGHTLMGGWPKGVRVPTNPLEDFRKISSVIQKDDRTVTIKVDLGRKPENRNQEIIQQMFFITHWQMVQRAYRESGLFPDTLESTLGLLNDFIKTMEESKGDQQIYLMYDRAAWDSMEFRMNLAHQYVSIEMFGVGPQPFRYQTISDVFAPFYPVYGVAIERHPDGTQELKRLFSNSDPDPLRVFDHRFEFTSDLNLEFLRTIAAQLAPNTSLILVSKTPLHTRLYKGIGFEVESSVFYEPWNATKVTLRSTRERFLERLSRRLQMHAETRPETQ